MKIMEKTLRGNLAQRGVVVLPNVQTFSLVMDDGRPVYELASRTSLIHEKALGDILTG